MSVRNDFPYRKGDKLVIIFPGQPYQIGEIVKILENSSRETNPLSYYKYRSIKLVRQNGELLTENHGYLNSSTRYATKLDKLFNE